MDNKAEIIAKLDELINQIKSQPANNCAAIKIEASKGGTIENVSFDGCNLVGYDKIADISATSGNVKDISFERLNASANDLKALPILEELKSVICAGKKDHGTIDKILEKLTVFGNLAVEVYKILHSQCYI